MIFTVVCGGNSLRGFDFSKLHGTVLTMNWATMHMDYDIAVCRDNPNRFGLSHNIPRLETLNHHKMKFKPARVYESFGLGVNRNPEQVTGYNCGLTTALNVAIHHGAKTIYLLGADNRRDEFYHFYDTEPLTWQQDCQMESFHKNIEEFMHGFKAGLNDDEQIITVESSLTMFENITLDEYVKIGSS